MSHVDPASDAPRSTLAYVAAAILILLVVLAAWYLMERSAHTIAVALHLLYVLTP